MNAVEVDIVSILQLTDKILLLWTKLGASCKLCTHCNTTITRILVLTIIWKQIIIYWRYNFILSLVTNLSRVNCEDSETTNACLRHTKLPIIKKIIRTCYRER